MSALSDLSLRAQIGAGRLVIEPLAEDAIQPASIDLTLGPILLIPGPGQHVDLSANVLPNRHTPISLAESHCVLKPGGSVLGATAERIVIPTDLMGLLVGRSTLARLFLQVEAAGLLDPGYEGHPTLEITNHGPHTIWLNAGDPICQLVLLRLTTVAQRPYAGRYQGDRAPTPARTAEATGGGGS